MTQPQIFIALLASLLFCISGMREITRRNFAMGTLLIAIPMCGWLSIWVKS
jgi:hypothetical protein